MVRFWLQGPSPNDGSLFSSARARRGVLLGATVVAIGALGAQGFVRRYPLERSVKQNRKILITPFVADVVCGAAAEFVHLLVFYPVDTIKVRCQTCGINFIQSLQTFAKVGLNRQLLGQLYAGAGPAAVFSLLVGPVYFASYGFAKRAARHWIDGSPSSSSTKETSAHEKHLHGNDVGDGGHSWLFVNLVASLVSGIAVSVVEAPAELLRHQAQAGVFPGGLLANIARGFSLSRLWNLYFCYIPFLIKSLPYDVAELMTYGFLSDLRDKSVSNASQDADTHLKVPEHAIDLLIGAAAGAMAVLASMPADLINTRMQTVDRHGMKGKNLFQVMVAFFLTGKQLVAKTGLRALFRGCTPRLMNHVPASMLFWLTVETCQRALNQPREDYVQSGI